MNILSKMLLALLNRDYVVEQGKSGNWYYRKWNSGFAECWCTENRTVAVTTSSTTYGGYRSNEIDSTNFPFTFKSTPVVTAQFSTTSQGAWVNNVNGTSTSHVGFYASAGGSLSSTSRTLHFTARGYWK